MQAIFILTIMEYTVRHYLEYAATVKVEADTKEEALKKACI